MKRLVIITVGKTHSGKTTFAHALEEQLINSFVVDQDNHAQFLNTYYKKLQRDEGPNILKHSLSKLMVDYAKEHTDFHFIICNSNRSLKGRKYLLEDLFPAEDFVRILVHFDISYDVLHSRVKHSQRSTNIFRGPIKNFDELLVRQHEESLKEDIVDPTEQEADHLFVVKDDNDMDLVIKSKIHIAQTSL
ncbi:AAA family ATPase [Solibacillus sp. NPDC093137]|uniref:AAA family ATPase n=1 Tax=Solibacillus sp. NPDC093137 TaxID=3390678 RepID=UPI003CFBDBFB